MDDRHFENLAGDEPIADEPVDGVDLDDAVLDRLAAYGQTPEPERTDPMAPAFEAAAPPEVDVRADPEPVVAPTVEHEGARDETRATLGGRFRRATRAASRGKRKNDGRAKRVVGLKIGSTQIAAAQVLNNGAPELQEIARTPLEPGLVVSGEVRDPDALSDALRRFFELHKLPKRGIRLGISNNRIGVRIFEIEGVSDPRQLDNAIRFRAEEVLPIPLDQAVLDYVVLEEQDKEDGTPWKRILIVVAYREVVDKYLQVCTQAGLQVVGIDLEAFALLRSLEAPTDRTHASGAFVAVAIGNDRSTVAVSTGRHCEFTRVLDWGGASLNLAIARELDSTPSEVEAIKRQLSFGQDVLVDGLSADQATRARDGIERSLAAFTRELVASLQFYQAQPGALGIGEIVLTGGTAHMPGLLDAVGRLAGVPTRLGDPFHRVKASSRVLEHEQPGSVSIAIGLGIED